MNSLWIETTKNELNLKPMGNDEEAEVCVIGAGLFGLTTAYYLTLLGKKVTVVERGEIGEKVSGNTTGKITSQHGLFYDHLIKDYGEEYARKYLEANEEAIKNIKDIIEKEKIDCDFSERKAYVYAFKEDEVLEDTEQVSSIEDSTGDEVATNVGEVTEVVDQEVVDPEVVVTDNIVEETIANDKVEIEYVEEYEEEDK